MWKRRLLFLLLAAWLAAGCAEKPPVPGQVADTIHGPKSLYALLPDDPHAPLLPSGCQADYFRDFLARQFGPWKREAPENGADKVFWGLDVYGSKELYGSNLLPLHGGSAGDSAWLTRMRRLCRVEDFPSMARPAITVAGTSMRVLPTDQPVFYDPGAAGEGYPFDYMQNSGLFAGTPLFVSHVSADGAWYLAECRYAYGWLPARDVAFVDQGFAWAWSRGPYLAVTDDDAAVYGEEGAFLGRARLGMLLPLTAATPRGFEVAWPGRDTRGRAVTLTGFVAASAAEEAPVPFTAFNAATLGMELMGRPYGWGGLHGNRDCSSTLLDLYACFGIYLPRNSKQQAEYLCLSDLTRMSPGDKKTYILRNGRPYLSFIRKPGHIMLYVGEANGEPMVLQTLWGLKTVSRQGVEGRHVMGRTLLTGLSAGEELSRVRRAGGVILDQVVAMSRLPACPGACAPAANGR